jgi:hypothetical protein
MCTFFYSCHTYTLASDYQLEQPSWLNNSGQFSQKKKWLRMVINGEFVGMSVTLSNACYLKCFIDDSTLPTQSRHPIKTSRSWFLKKAFH